MNWILTQKETPTGYNPHERAAHMKAGRMGLEATYRHWREHQQHCQNCMTQDWYDPWWKDQLCQEGRDLFASWVKLSMVNPPSLKRGSGTKRDSYLTAEDKNNETY